MDRTRASGSQISHISKETTIQTDTIMVTVIQQKGRKLLFENVSLRRRVATPRGFEPGCRRERPVS
ncbi:MAG: hypothetical protein CM15mP62_23470 [Rhodospirillaceae bacterium]|nr:MAG: hypothetical protein CM15mP62_23470 [Rhodospirillaceae bacterium]